MPRKVTNKIYGLIEDGLVSMEYVLDACLSYMSEYEVAEMARINDIYDEDEDD